MAWQTLGRAGYWGRGRDRRQRELDQRFGPGRWRVVHLVKGMALELPDAAKHYEESYFQFLIRDPQLLDWLCAKACDVYTTATSNVRSGLDYRIQETKQEHLLDIALRNVLSRLSRCFSGERLVRIGGRQGDRVELGSGRVPFYRPEWIAQPALEHWWEPGSVECFWQSNKVIQANAD